MYYFFSLLVNVLLLFYEQSAPLYVTNISSAKSTRPTARWDNLLVEKLAYKTTFNA